MAVEALAPPPPRSLARGRAPGPLDDGVTADRRELKFVFPGQSVADLRGILSVNAEPIRFGSGDVSRVNSIYFDDYHLSSCAESLAGVSRRVKLRLRWYDEEFAARTLFFEAKRRSGQKTSKERTPLEALKSLGDIPYGELLSGIAPALDEETSVLLGMRSDPVALVCYRREHFRCPGSGIRITLDYDIEAFMQLGNDRPRRDSRVALDGLVVVEVKTSEKELPQVRAALHPLTPRLARCSKYVQCCLADPLASVLLRD